ncbi:MAG TPA: ribonuclease P protein component [Rectinema sp.]|nr:ribonuclease P protein component [Rectinema sp.]
MRRRNTENTQSGIQEERQDRSFPKSLRVRKTKEIDLIFEKGARFSCKGMRMHVLLKEGQESRVAFIAGRAFSGAVTRNRAKRLAREAWRHIRNSVKPGFDIVFVLYPGLETFVDCYSAMQYLLRKADLLL